MRTSEINKRVRLAREIVAGTRQDQPDLAEKAGLHKDRLRAITPKTGGVRGQPPSLEELIALARAAGERYPEYFVLERLGAKSPHGASTLNAKLDMLSGKLAEVGVSTRALDARVKALENEVPERLDKIAAAFDDGGFVTKAIQQAFEDYAERLGPSVGKRPRRSRRNADRPPE